MSQQTSLVKKEEMAQNNSISCPKCGEEISITEALSADIKTHYKKEFQQIILERNKEIEALQGTLEKEKISLIQERKSLEEVISKRLEVEKASLEKKIRNTLINQSQLETQDLKNQLLEKTKRIEEAEIKELESRKRARAIEEREKSLELELQRKFDAEKLKIQEDISKRVLDDQQLKMAEKDKQLDDMRRQIEILKRKAEQSSQQAQGEVLEIEIEAILRNLFPLDTIEPVAKGVKGGDIIHRIVGFSGQLVGTIIWETKRTKNWSDGWVDKLKEDQREIAAEFAILVTQAMPKDIHSLAVIDGIFVVDFQTFKGLAITLRNNLIQLYQARVMAVSKGEKLDFLYDYLTGTQFKQRIEAIVEAFHAMQMDLAKEKRVAQRIWAAREQQIEKVLISTSGM
jgi:hypothetical protein